MIRVQSFTKMSKSQFRSI